MKNLISLTEFNRQDVTQVLEVATQMRRVVLTAYKKGPQLIGHVVSGVWQKPCLSSTAFSLAAAYLSGTAMPIFGVEDVLSHCRSLDNMGVNTVVVSSENDNIVRQFASNARCRVINGGSSQFDPVGVLADLMTLMLKLDGLNNLSVLAVGNKEHNKITELSHCLQLFDSNLVWYLPVEDFSTPRKGIVLNSIETAFAGTDAVVDLGLQQFADATKYYGTAGGISEKLIGKARVDAPLLGASTVVDNIGIKQYAHSALSTRESCYVSVAMAVLYMMTKN